MSRAWLDSACKLPGVELVGLVDIIEDAARKRASEYSLHNAVIGTDVRSVLEQTSPDAIFNCTIPEAHYETTLVALNHGCHVLCEKPLADSMEHARELVATAQHVGRLFAIIQNRRYDPTIRRLQALVTEGTLGPITTINSDFYIGAHFGGFRDHMPHVLLLDMAIHTFDAARLLTGADPLAVYCKEWNPAGSWYDQDASAIAVFEMTGGIVYTYRGSWCSNGLHTTWESDWRIIGQQGSAQWDGGEQFQAQVVAETGGFSARYQDVQLPAPTNETGARGHDALIQEFISCMRTGKRPETSADDNIKSLAMVFGAIESAETGRRVEIAL